MRAAFILVEPFDLDAYAEALARLMSDDELRRKIATNCREKVTDYSIDRVGQRWVELLERLS